MNISSSENTFHTIIFGSGLSGLSCARKLALLNKNVCVIEKSQHLGGHLPSFERNGAHFEVGIHYIAAASAGSLFAKGCAKLGIEPQLVPLDPLFERAHNEGLGITFEMDASFKTHIANLKARFPEHSHAFEQLYSDANGLWEIANSIKFPYTNWNMAIALLRSPRRFRLLRIALRSLAGYLQRTLKLPRDAVEIVSLHHVLLGVNPKKLSAVVYLLVHRYYFENPSFIRGGGTWLTNALVHNKVKYMLGENAKVEATSNSPTARFKVKTSQGDLFAHNIVWTPDPRLFSAASNIPLGLWKNFQLSRAQNPHALVIGYFATKDPLDAVGMRNANHWLMGTLNSEDCYADMSLRELAERAPIYLSTGSLRDPIAIDANNGMGAQGVFQAMFLVPTDAERWGVSDTTKYRVPENRGGSAKSYKAHKIEVMNALKNRLFATFPKLESSLCYEDLGTPLTHERYLFSLSRNGYGFAPTVADLLLWRPNFKTSTPGLYLCGAHIKPAHGIATTLLNGVGMAELLEKEFP